MIRTRAFSIPCYSVCISFFLVISSGFGQVRKEFIDYLQEYSQTGYYIITEYEKKVNNPGYHKQFIEDKNLPLPVVAVHEVCHMWNWEIGGGVSSSGNQFGYCLGYNQSFVAKKAFSIFKSSEIKSTIPTELQTSITDIYINGSIGETGSIVHGLYGILDEYSTYVNGLKSLVEMCPCFKKEFNTKDNWPKYCLSGSASIEGSTEFRYFILKYILYAKTKYKTEYDKIIADLEIKNLYTKLTRYHERTAAEYLAIFDSVNITLVNMGASQLQEKNYGIDWYKKFKNELAKQEYQDLEKILLIDMNSIQKLSPGYTTPDFNVFCAPSRILVNCHIPHSGSVTLSLYSIDGRMIKTYNRNNVPEGNQRLDFYYNNKELQSCGMYIIRLETAGFLKARTAVVRLY